MIIILPKIRCPGCGKLMDSVKAAEIPPANTLEDCLRRCKKCNIGASNAKNPLKVKFIFPAPKAGDAENKEPGPGRNP